MNPRRNEPKTKRQQRIQSFAALLCLLTPALAQAKTAWHCQAQCVYLDREAGIVEDLEQVDGISVARGDAGNEMLELCRWRARRRHGQRYDGAAVLASRVNHWRRDQRNERDEARDSSTEFHLSEQEGWSQARSLRFSSVRLDASINSRSRSRETFESQEFAVEIEYVSPMDPGICRKEVLPPGWTPRYEGSETPAG